MPNVQGFIQQYAPVAASVSQRIGVSPDVLLGQWGLETGWGKSVIPGTNNLGNIKGPGAAATDNQTGSNDQYRAYASPQAFGDDFANLISSNYRGAVGAGSDASAYGKALAKGGYAEDSGYANKLAGAVGMVRKFGDSIASALSGSANAAELSAQQTGAPVISATGQQIMPQTKPQSPTASPPRTSTSDPLLDMANGVMAGSPAASSPPPTTTASAQTAQAADDPLLAMANSVMSAKDTPAKSKTPAPGPDTKTHESTPLDMLGAAVEPLLTAGTSMIAAPVGGLVRLGSAALGNSFSDAKSTGNKVTDALTYHPQTQGGQQALAGLGDMATSAKNAVMNSPVGPAISAVGNAYNDTFVKGAPNPLMATINAQVPSVVGNVVAGKAGSALVDGLTAAPNALKQAISKPDAAAERVEPSMQPTGSVPPSGPPAAPPSNPAPAAVVPGAPGASAQGATLRGVGAAEANQNPYAGQLTGEEAARGGSSAFPQVKVSKNAGDVPADEQALRAQIANEILGPENDAVRTGVVTGNEDVLRSEHTLSRSSDNTPEQIALRNQIAREQHALSNYAQARIDATGASPNLTNNEQRGQVINDAVHGEGGLNEWFQQAKQQIYDQARAESGDNPIQTSHVDALLGDPQFVAEAERGGNSRVVSGITQLMDLARNTGFRDPITGEVTSPGSVAAWDAVRKSNNADWNDGNARTIGAINRAIDQDIAAAAGSDAYKLGDAIHQAQQTITGARGFKQIFGDADANGVKSGAAVEQIPGRLNNMPLDQWRHIYNTFDDLSRGRVAGAPDGAPPVPQDLQQMALAAKNEMSGALAREVYEQGAGKAGVWNQNSVNKTLNSVVGHKILQTFPPDEIEKFHTLNYGGQIMPGVHSYEGAGLQTQRLNKGSLVEKHAGKIGASLGGGLGGAISGGAAASAGAGAGAWAGNKLAAGLASKRLEGEANQLIEAMRSNSKRGR
ncbi:glucosaminidase domain-containing protein [Paraburkholderia caledonica]|uniref:glucosaminidase domain-containing protein n=1 Tax=Paraburkholderia caledonica TaxID=134536 RepID=UPI0038BD2469